MFSVERCVVLNGLFDLVFVTLARRPTTMFLSFAVNDSFFVVIAAFVFLAGACMVCSFVFI